MHGLIPSDISCSFDSRSIHTCLHFHHWYDMSNNVLLLTHLKDTPVFTIMRVYDIKLSTPAASITHP